MKDIKIISISKEVEDAYRFISDKPGSDRVNNVYNQKHGSMQVVYDVLKNGNSDHVLEFGPGIGTFDYLILKNFNSFIDSYEDNDFCRKELDNNLCDFKGRYKVFYDQNNFDCSFDSYDLVIVDANWYESVPKLLEKAKIKKIYFDNTRFRIRETFLKELRKQYVCKFTSYSYDQSKFKVGYLLDCAPEKNGLKRWCNYFYNYFSIYAVDFKDKGHRRIKARIKNLIKKLLLIK